MNSPAAFVVQVTEIRPAESFGEAKIFAVRITALEPRPVVITGTFHHQRVAFPMSHRVAHPGRTRILRKVAAV